MVLISNTLNILMKKSTSAICIEEQLFRNLFTNQIYISYTTTSTKKKKLNILIIMKVNYVIVIYFNLAFNVAKGINFQYILICVL